MVNAFFSFIKKKKKNVFVIIFLILFMFCRQAEAVP